MVYDQKTCNERHRWIKWGFALLLATSGAVGTVFGPAIWFGYMMISEVDARMFGTSRELKTAIEKNRSNVQTTSKTAARIEADRTADQKVTDLYRLQIKDTITAMQADIKIIADTQQQMLRKQDVMSEQLERLLKKVQ